MHKPKTVAQSAWRESLLELGVLYIAASIAASYLLSMHWLLAMLVAPFIVLVLIASLVLLVQLMWMFITALEKIGTSLGLRKSPLA